MSLLQVGARLRRRAGVPADSDPLDQKIPRRVPLSAGHHHGRVGVSSMQALNFLHEASQLSNPVLLWQSLS